jgi:hypothetical protein
MSSICRKKWQRRGFASGPLGNKGPCSGGCDDFTLTVEALAVVNPGFDTDFGFITTPTNQEYFFKEEDGEIVSTIIPWVIFPPTGTDVNILPTLNIRTDRSCCQDAIQISLVGEDIQDLNEVVPLNFEVPAGESAIMIPLVFSEGASFGPKIIGVQAIGCGQNKIKDLYFEYIDPNAFECPDEIRGFISTFNSTSNPDDGTTVSLNIYNFSNGNFVSGDYEIIITSEDMVAPIILSGSISEGQNINIPISETWGSSKNGEVTVKFTPYEFEGIECGTYCETFTYSGYVSYGLTLTNNDACQHEPYYGMSAIGEGLLVGLRPGSKNYVTINDKGTTSEAG